jgi:hypothetical protein
MAVGVVDPLEVVEVEQQQRERVAVPPVRCDLALQPLLERAVVEATGEAVDAREVLQHGGRAAQLRRDVGVGAR